MSLTETEKLQICQAYDELVSKKSSFVAVLPRNVSPNLINFSNYNINSGQYHINNAYNIADIILKRWPHLDRGEILQYIGNPDFEVLLDVNNNTLNTGTNSLEDAIIIRQLEEQIVIEKKQKVPRKVSKTGGHHLPITKVSKLNLGVNLFHLSEEVIFVPEKLYYKLLKYLCKTEATEKRIPLNQVPFDQNFKLKLWELLLEENFPKFKTMPDKIYTSMLTYTKKFAKHHLGIIEQADFIATKKIAFDNRRHSKSTESSENTEGVLSLVHQKITLNQTKVHK